CAPGCLITSRVIGTAMAQSFESKAISAEGKPLHGAAKNSFMAKCKRGQLRHGQCPLWVKSGHRSTSNQCPLYPHRKRTSELRRGMSALCQKQTFASLFDHLVGCHLHRHRYGKAERLRGLEVYDELEFRRLLYRQIGRRLPFEDTIHIGCGAPILVELINSVGHKPTITDEFWIGVQCR